MNDYYEKVNLQNRVRDSDSSRQNSIITKDDTILYSPYQYKTLIVNSRERDRTAYDDAFNFQIRLDDPIRFVRSIKLIDFICHLERRYLIHAYNNSYETSTDGITFTTQTISQGDYNLVTYNTDQGTNSLTTALTTSFADFSFEILNNTEKIKITNVNASTRYIRFPTTSSNKDSLAYILGFKPDTIYTINGSNGTLDAPYRINFVKSSVAVISINNNDFNVVDANLANKTNQTYGIVNIDKDYNKYKAGTPIVKYFYNPLNYLDRLKIEIKDIYGNYFDFHDSDLIMTFLIEYENQRN